INDADVLHVDAALEAGPDRFREGLLGCKALCEGPGAGVRARRGLGALDVREDPLEEFVAPARERLLDPLNVAQGGADADDHPVDLVSRCEKMSTPRSSRRPPAE